MKHVDFGNRLMAYVADGILNTVLIFGLMDVINGNKTAWIYTDNDETGK